MRAIEVLTASRATYVEDLGRPGYGAVGVGVSGAADLVSHRLANRLVGNPESDATIEVTFGGLSFVARAHLTIAVTGAPCPITVAGRAADHASPIYLAPGDTVTLGTPTAGLRTYVAVRGGIAVDPVLGSRSWDSLAQLGPEPLAPGSIVPIGEAPGVGTGGIDHAPSRVPTLEPITVRVIPGPRDEWVEFDQLLTRDWQVSSRSDRVGVRLEGTPLERRPAYADKELASEGVVRGSIQVPAGGLPVLFLADHPITGGYPVMGVIREADIDLIAQARPGQVIRFRRDREYTHG